MKGIRPSECTVVIGPWSFTQSFSMRGANCSLNGEVQSFPLYGNFKGFVIVEKWANLRQGQPQHWNHCQGNKIDLLVTIHCFTEELLGLAFMWMLHHPLKHHCHRHWEAPAPPARSPGVEEHEIEPQALTWPSNCPVQYLRVVMEQWTKQRNRTPSGTGHSV